MFNSFIKSIFYIIKRFILSVLLVYSFNMIVYPIGIIIPINFFTITFIMLCGFPAIIGVAIFIRFLL